MQAGYRDTGYYETPPALNYRHLDAGRFLGSCLHEDAERFLGSCLDEDAGRFLGSCLDEEHHGRLSQQGWEAQGVFWMRSCGCRCADSALAAAVPALSSGASPAASAGQGRSERGRTGTRTPRALPGRARSAAREGSGNNAVGARKQPRSAR